jgi:hypothetical protein
MELSELAKPFDESQLEWRVGRCGITRGNPWVMALCYIQSRAVMDRLDDVVGPAFWCDSYELTPEGVLCTLSIYCEGVWIAKQDGAPQTQIEGFKGGISDAFKRAAVKWGIGRYLYDLDEGFAETSLEKQRGWKRTKDSSTGTQIWWTPPELPGWAKP